MMIMETSTSMKDAKHLAGVTCEQKYALFII